jgi:hypothetical protein
VAGRIEGAYALERTDRAPIRQVRDEIVDRGDEPFFIEVVERRPYGF